MLRVPPGPADVLAMERVSPLPVLATDFHRLSRVFRHVLTTRARILLTPILNREEA